jgi:hypothetical protein
VSKWFVCPWYWTFSPLQGKTPFFLVYMSVRGSEAIISLGDRATSPAIVNVAERVKSSMCKMGRQNTIETVDEDSVDTEDELNRELIAPQETPSLGRRGRVHSFVLNLGVSYLCWMHIPQMGLLHPNAVILDHVHC